jgi:hypothetical protein
MDLLSAATDLLTGGVLGGITGLVGNGINLFLDYKKQKLSNQHELDMMDKHKEAVVAEKDASIEIAKSTARIEEAKAEAAGFLKSMEGANTSTFDKSYMQGLPKWVRTLVAISFAGVDVMKGTIRPVLTYSLYVAMVGMIVICYRQSPEAFVVEVVKLLPMLIKTIAYLGAVVVWGAHEKKSDTMGW